MWGVLAGSDFYFRGRESWLSGEGPGPAQPDLGAQARGGGWPLSEAFGKLLREAAVLLVPLALCPGLYGNAGRWDYSFQPETEVQGGQ